MGIQQIILYVTVTVIAGILLLMMFTVQQRSSDASIDATQYRSAKKAVLNLVEMIEHDFKNIGAYMYWDEANGKFEAVGMDPQNVIPADGRDSVAVEGGYHHSFEFISQVEPNEPPTLVRYEWRPTGDNVVLSNGIERQLFTVERYVNGAISGISTEIVTQMTVKLRPAPGGIPITTNTGETRQIDVKIRAISPLGRGELIEEPVFETSYRPVAMSITDQMQ